MYRGQYKRYEYPVEFTGETEEPIYGDTFYGKHGFLTDDVTHWMYADDFGVDEEPPIPEGFIMIDEGKHREYALKEDTVRITKYEYEGLKETVKYLEAGHLYGMCCTEDDCPCHIYWQEEHDGYRCDGCQITYSTEDVETYPYKYESMYGRPCPECNDHEENSKEHYLNGFLGYSAGNEPHSTEHYICNKCDSTYGIGEI